MRFCATLLGFAVVLAFLLAIVIGIPFQGLWDAVFVPVFAATPFILLPLIVIFGLRGVYLRAKAKHYATLLKMQTDPRFR